MDVCSLYDSIGEVVKGLIQCPISEELETFSRLLYRNKNQHRRDRYFQKLVRICKDSKKYQDLKLTEKFKCLQRLLAKYKFSFTSSKKTDYLSDTETQDLILQLVQQTSQCVLFIEKIIKFCEDTFFVIRQHYLTQGLFVPFNLMMCAILSRLWAYLKYHNNFLSQAHSILTEGHNRKAPDADPVETQAADVGEIVTLDQGFMQSRARDFQLPVCVQSTINEVATVKVEKLNKKDTEHVTKISYKTQHKTRHRWRNTFTSNTGCFCVDFWMSSKRNYVRKSRLRKRRRNAIASKKEVHRKCIASAGQRTGENFIDNIFSLIRS